MSLLVSNKTKRPIPKVEFREITKEVLGEDYELSLVFVTPSISHHLNKKYRGKNYATDVLSFPLEKKSGEIFLDLTTTRKKSSEFGMHFEQFVAFLFIHGCLHLKGMEHGVKMEKAEKSYLNVASNRRWY